MENGLMVKRAVQAMKSEKGEALGDSLITIIAIVLAAILMFLFPLLAVSQSGDDVAQLSVQTATTEFTDNIRTTGQLTMKDYNTFVEKLAATNNTYEIEMEFKIKDINPAKKTAQVQYEKIGENTYYIVYTAQIENQLRATGSFKLKEGDMVSVNVKNTNMTISQSLRNLFYKVSGNSSYQIGASDSGIVTVNSK